MSIYVPEYYSKFKCTPEECKHNCCIGWEIDIDADTAQKYINDAGVLKDKFKKSIKYENECHQFILGEKERCPFLNDNNLCEIILNYGEDALCEICTLHPRFKNFIGDREEIGLGLTCEIAGNVIINNKQSFRLIPVSKDENLTDDELEFLNYRDELITIATDRTISLNERIRKLITLTDVDLTKLTTDVWIELLSDLEILNPIWSDMLNDIEASFSVCEIDFSENEIIFENLLSYFIYRQFTPAFDDEYYIERLIFCVFSVCIIKVMCDTFSESVVEISRLYSSEIEYSDENIYNLLDEITYFK